MERTIDQIVRDALGLEFEYHRVTTEDGYILEMHRLFKSHDDQYEQGDVLGRPVVFM